MINNIQELSHNKWWLVKFPHQIYCEKIPALWRLYYAAAMFTLVVWCLHYPNGHSTRQIKEHMRGWDSTWEIIMACVHINNNTILCLVRYWFNGIRIAANEPKVKHMSGPRYPGHCRIFVATGEYTIIFRKKEVLWRAVSIYVQRKFICKSTQNIMFIN